MSEGILVAVPGPAEALLVRAADASHGRLAVTRRCVDLDELLACAEAGLGRVAALAAGLAAVDRDSVDRLRRRGLHVVVLVDPQRPDEPRRGAALGADLVAPAPRDAAEADSLLAAVQDLLQGAGPGVVAPRRNTPVQADPEPPRPLGSVVAVWGPTGAPGRTTTAVNLAAELAADSPVLLADADTYGGAVAQVVGLLDEAPGIAAAARAAAQGTLDLPALARFAPVLLPNLRLLSGISRADRWPELPAAALDLTWSLARRLADWVVVDTGFCLEQDEELTYDTRAPRRNGATLSALEAADLVVVVGATDPVGMQRLVRALAELSDAGLGGQRLVVANRVRPGTVGRRPDDAVRQALARYAGVTDPHLVPDDRDALDRALLEGRALREVAPGSPARSAVAALARRVRSACAAPQEAEPAAAVRSRHH